MVIKHSRAQRRHDNIRMYKRAKKLVSVWEYDPEYLDWKVKRIFNNMSNCSCSMCCNERSNGWNSGRLNLSMQERRSEDDYNDWMEDII